VEDKNQLAMLIMSLCFWKISRQHFCVLKCMMFSPSYFLEIQNQWKTIYLPRWSWYLITIHV